MARVDRQSTHLLPMGDRAWLASFPSELHARAWSEAARVLGLIGVEIVLAYQNVVIVATEDNVDLEAVEKQLGLLETPRFSRLPLGRLHRIPVLYDGADLDEVADLLGLSRERVIELHTAPEYFVHAIGFQPGFPYLGDLPEPLNRIPRRQSPRPKVPAGSVAIAAGQTGIYPADLPGGWHLLGRTPLSIVDLSAGRFPIEAGDRVRFFPISLDELPSHEGQAL